MPVCLLGCADATDLSRWGMFLADDSGVMRMQDEAGQAPADRRWSDVASDERTQTASDLCTCNVGSLIAVDPSQFAQRT